METAGKEITSFKVEAHLKDGSVERKPLKRKRKEGVKCLYRNVWSKSFQMPLSVLSVVLDSDWEVARFSKITICQIKL